MRFQVPQFIGIEDKIFGPFTAKQFVYLAGGAALCYMFYKYFPLLISLIFIVPIGALAIALAFIKVNGKPFVFILEAAVKYYFGGKLYLWRKTERSSAPKENSPTQLETSDIVPRLSESKLSETSWKLDAGEQTGEIGKRR